MWSDTITDLTLTVDSVVVGDTDGDEPTLLDVSWGSGRPDWFASLSPSTASFRLLGDLSASVACGDSMVLAKGATALWTGKVDSVTLVETPGQPDTTMVTGADFVAQLGEAQLKNYSEGAASFEVQLDGVLTTVGLTATITTGVSLPVPGLGDWTSYDGSVLDWVETAERYSNTIIAVQPSGVIRLCPRMAFPHYGQRIYDTNLGAPDVPGLPLATSLWSMQESSGNLTDLISGRTATAAGTPTYAQTGPWGTDGRKGIGLQKADAADKFTVGDYYDLADGVTTTWTVAGWLYWDGSTGSVSPVMSKQAAGPSGWQLRVETSGVLTCAVSNAGSIGSVASSALTANEWTHFAVVRDGSALRLYVDAGLVDSDTLSGSMVDTATSLTIGTDGTGWFGGRLTMLSVWRDDALTQAQLNTLVYLDYVDLPTPTSWATQRSITSVINHWLIAGVTTTDTTSVTAYGRRSFNVDDSTLMDDPDAYTSDLRTIMKDPRPIVTATYDVLDSSSVLIDIAPLTLVLYDGTYYQVLDVRHSVSPAAWGVTLILDRTQNDMTTGELMLPA